MASLLQSSSCVTIQAIAKQSATLVFLHGLGDTGHGWASILEQCRQPHVRIICPTAPTMPVTINRGARMPSWFDIQSLDKGSGEEDEQGIMKAVKDIHEIIDMEEKAGTPTNRIILGGFSQGGALAIYSALTYPRQLGGLLCLSGYAPLFAKLSEDAKNGVNNSIPMLQCHGEIDPMVKFSYGQLTHKFLSSLNPTNIQFKSYPLMGHSSCPQELADVQEWMSTILLPSGGSM